MRISPITCYRPTPEAAPTFACMPYDVFNTAEATAYLETHPGSFLAIDRPETSFEPGHDPYAPEVYERAGELIRATALQGTLLKDQTPCLYLYRLAEGDHAQLGVVAAVSVAEYEDGTIRRHEETRPEKELDRTCHIRATGAQTGPVFITYRDNLAIDIICQAACASTPLYDFTDEFGVRQTIWRVSRPVAIESLQVAFEGIPAAYIADGHHRAAAAARYAREQRDEATGEEDERAADSFLAVLFPASQLTVMAYNRVVYDRCGLGVSELLDAIARAGYDVRTANGPVEPTTPRTLGLYLGGSWYELAYQGPEPEPARGPAAALDVSILQERILRPILGIDDPRTNRRIRFVGGIRGTAGLEEAAGTEGLAFSLCPTSVDDLMRVSDAGQLMPPKSTWFEPKLRSGLFIRRV